MLPSKRQQAFIFKKAAQFISGEYIHDTNLYDMDKVEILSKLYNQMDLPQLQNLERKLKKKGIISETK